MASFALFNHLLPKQFSEIHIVNSNTSFSEITNGFAIDTAAIHMKILVTNAEKRGIFHKFKIPISYFFLLTSLISIDNAKSSRCSLTSLIKLLFIILKINQKFNLQTSVKNVD